MPARQASPSPERPPEAKVSPTSAAATATVTTSFEQQNDTTSSSSAAAAADSISNNDIYQHSNHVYILDPEHSWIPAQVTTRTKSSSSDNDATAVAPIIHVSVPQYKSEQAIQCDGGRTARSFKKMEIDLAKHSALYPSLHLPLQNVNNEGELEVVEDMVDLPFLHEVSETNYTSLQNVLWRSS